MAARDSTFGKRPDPADDRVLVAAAREGDGLAFSQLADRHYARVLGYLEHQTHDPVLAADLTQQTFLRALRSMTRLRDDELFAAWLIRIARNRLRSHWEYQRLRRFVSLEWLAASGATPPPVLWGNDESEPCHERALLNQVLVELSSASQEVLLLNCYDGFTALEIAHILGISRPAAERRLSRAKEQFRERYRRLNGEEQ